MTLREIVKHKSTFSTVELHEAIKDRADVNARDEHGRTVLDVALDSGNWPAALVILKLGGRLSRRGIFKRWLPLQKEIRR